MIGPGWGHVEVLFVLMAGDVDQVAIGGAYEEPPHAPGFGGEWMDDLEAASLRFLVRLLYAVAHGDRDHRVIRSGSVAGDELHDGTAVRGLESGHPAHIEPFVAEPKIVDVEVASFTNVRDRQVGNDTGGLHDGLLLSVRVPVAILLRYAASVQRNGRKGL